MCVVFDLGKRGWPLSLSILMFRAGITDLRLPRPPRQIAVEMDSPGFHCMPQVGRGMNKLNFLNVRQLIVDEIEWR